MTLKPAIALVLVAFGLAGCGIHLLPQPEDQGRLAFACETAQCDCHAPRSAIPFSSDTVKPVQWRPDGSAFCPEGMLLGRVQQ
jgi:hypothetical protein